jgi:LPXTG-motif cell wall-anchored protein
MGQLSHAGGAAVKKLPIIGLVIGAIVALFASRKRKRHDADQETPGAGGESAS